MDSLECKDASPARAADISMPGSETTRQLMSSRKCLDNEIFGDGGRLAHWRPLSANVPARAEAIQVFPSRLEVLCFGFDG